MTLLSDSQIVQVFERFKKANPQPKSELEYTSPFTLLVAVALSAQTTDKSVNKVTRRLFEQADTPEQMAALGEEKLSQYIKSIGLYKTKAKHVVEMSRMLVEKFGSVVPDTREELELLPGVGRKTANVVLNVIFKKPVMPVDTHLLRISPKIGLTEGKTPLEIEKGLMQRIPERYLEHAHHWLILHGRYVCKANNPKCQECIINDICCKNVIKKEAPDE